ncbi:hypothetical protein [Methylorubrum sp. POS3]|uniref:hypothetical protein n=1 Tax=Methylorubrum sp. POS3 TaxID=2998492 RepID=UPI00372889C6
MQPIAKDISAWCDAFQEKAKGAGSSFDGWSYPDRETIDFWPDDPVGYRRATVNRARVLFGETLLRDPLEKSTNADFHLVPSAFLHKAARCQPRNPQANASAFAQWVYSLYANASGSEDDQQRGKDIEKDIWSLKIKAVRSLDSDVLRRSFSIWNLMHNGLHVEKRNEGAYFDISSLRVNGVPLRASPDLIYKNKKTGEVLIVEIKNSYLDLPRNLWPNVWAQLWCYSKVDVAARAEKVTAVAEVWADRYVRIRRDSKKVVSLRALVRRDPRAPAYDKFFQELFDIYCGNLKN